MLRKRVNRSTKKIKKLPALGIVTCQKCGYCCYQSFKIGKLVFHTDIPCKYLDLRTKLCTVYEKRRQLNPKCITVKEGIQRRCLQDSCPYVKNIKGYLGPFEANWEELKGMIGKN